MIRRGTQAASAIESVTQLSDRPASPPRPVRPRNAASLILMRHRGGHVEVLLGRRARAHAFLPDFYVFPGGRLDRDDHRVTPASPLRPEVTRRVALSCPRASAQAYALAAVRETSEEVGLVIGSPSAHVHPPSWRGFAGAGLLPALDALDYVGRAITPPEAPIRYHNRFFLVDGRHAKGELRSNGELLDLGWRTIEEALALGLVDVTEFMLGEATRLFRGETSGRHRKTPLFGYRGGREWIRYE
jgi:8-oxo-dGTP pyrophosphatase MutT (NUDIX family)